jgi:hypothetical protein
MDADGIASKQLKRGWALRVKPEDQVWALDGQVFYLPGLLNGGVVTQCQHSGILYAERPLIFV